MVRVLALVICMLSYSITGLGAKQRLLIFAAASMKNVLEEIGREFQAKCDCDVVFSFAGSGILARQIEAGAPADIFISADMEWMDWLREREAVVAGSISVIASNRLVVVTNTDREPGDGMELGKVLGSGRIAMADPVSVPAGRYGKQALQSLRLWKVLTKQLVFGENVRISLALAARGDVDTAIVYRSDLQIEPRVKLAYLFDMDTHEPITYPAARISSGKLGAGFMEYLQAGSVAKIFSRFGFSVAADD